MGLSAKRTARWYAPACRVLHDAGCRFTERPPGSCRIGRCSRLQDRPTAHFSSDAARCEPQGLTGVAALGARLPGRCVPPMATDPDAWCTLLRQPGTTP